MQVDEEDTMETIHEDDEDQDHSNQPGTDAFIPGRHVLEKDEILEPDDSVYEMRHSMQVKWPSLSFDVLRDNLGDQRQRYPATAYIVAGTQAPSAKDNELSVYKMSALHRTQNDGGKPSR
jgi:ribosome assembly protein RRB1